MGVREGFLWEIERPPAGVLAIRRFGWPPHGQQKQVRGCGGAVAGLAVLAVVVVALLGFSARRDLDAAWRENLSLRAEQGTLRERAFDLAGRAVQDVADGRRMVWWGATPGRLWAEPLRMPVREAGDDALLAWLSSQNVRLEVLANELSVTPVELGAAPAPAPRCLEPAPWLASRI